MGRSGNDWKEIVSAQPKGYAEFQDMEQGLVFHGPVESVLIDEEDDVIISLKWVAQMGLPGKGGCGRWVKADDRYKKWIIPNLVVPFLYQNTERGKRIVFQGAYGTHLLYLDEVESGVKLEEVEVIR